ncbi:MAG: hypothetical protein ACRD4Y_05740 [Candidatus Acidiferrales bacterium]
MPPHLYQVRHNDNIPVRRRSNSAINSGISFVGKHGEAQTAWRDIKNVTCPWDTWIGPCYNPTLARKKSLWVAASAATIKRNQ